jgi:outer membrane protein assembly factor BamB
MRRRIVIVVALTSLMAATTALADSHYAVQDDPDMSEFHPGRSDGYLVWTSFKNAGGGGVNTWVRPDGSDPIRVNARYTDSFAGAIDGTTVVYDEWAEDADLRFFDAVTKQRSDPPAGVNTANDEQDPALSGDWLLFLRSNANRVAFRRAYVRLVLFNLQTSERKVLFDRREAAWYVATGQVNGDWLTYETCRERRFTFEDCQVFRYRISTQELLEIPNPGLQQYAAVVTSDGTVYFARGGRRTRWECGTRVKLFRYPVGGTPTLIARLPDGRDSITAFAYEEADTSTTLYFDQTNCRGRDGIYALDHADEAPL